MIANKTILAIVPARGGSKGVPMKNIRPLAGKPLIQWTGECIQQIPEIDRAIVSTDHDEIASAAEASGIQAPFRRPESLSGDRIGDWDVLTHALCEMEKLDDTRYDVILMLQPTCPLRQPAHIRAVMEKLIQDKLDTAWTVSPSDLKFHPLKQLKVNEEGTLSLYDPAGAAIIARQQLTPLFYRNGAAYAFTRECLLEQKSILGKKAGAVIVHDPLVNIDTPEDFLAAEKHLKKGS